MRESECKFVYRVALEKRTIGELRSLQQAPTGVHAVMQALLILLGEDPGRTSVTPARVHYLILPNLNRQHVPTQVAPSLAFELENN